MTRHSSPGGAPALDIDLYADKVLRDSRGAFAQIRAAGPAVWLPRHKMFAIGRFEDVRSALRNDAVFRSGEGVAANAVVNRVGRNTTLFSDDETHVRRRRVLMQSLGAKELKPTVPRLDEQAELIVGRLASGQQFETARDFSSHLPLSVVAELVGLDVDPDRLLRWAASTFDVLGTANLRGHIGVRRSLGLLIYSTLLRPGSVRPGSWAASVFEARDRGEVSSAEARSLIIDFVAPALDTTILATTHLLWILGCTPAAWDQIRSDPSLAERAVTENVRIASPIRGFTRTVFEDTAVDGVELARGSRVVLLFGAANLDETAFPEPEKLKLDRPSPVQLGWGHGPHTCVGLHLAKLEMSALMRAMIPRVAALEVGEPERLLNNTLQGISRLPARFVSA
jgi:cytochrome P450